jgi:hypothetical protein
MPKGYLNLKQIARIDFLYERCITIKLINHYSKPSAEIIIFTNKKI